MFFFQTGPSPHLFPQFTIMRVAWRNPHCGRDQVLVAWWKTLLGGEEARAGLSYLWSSQSSHSSPQRCWRGDSRIWSGLEVLREFCCKKSYAALGFIFKRQLISTRLYGMETMSLPSWFCIMSSGLNLLSIQHIFGAFYVSGITLVTKYSEIILSALMGLTVLWKRPILDKTQILSLHLVVTS